MADEVTGRPLLDALTGSMAHKADTRAVGRPREALGRFGWTTRDIADRFGVSGRTARRWVQQDRIPARRAEDWREGTRAEAARRQRDRIEARGLKGMSVTGVYRVSRSKNRARPGHPVKIMPGRGISGADMREVFSAMDQGRMGEAERLLGEHLGRAYGTGGGVRFEDVDSLSYTVR